MKALTIWQPWASAILLSGKDVENRTWRTDYRGPVLVHAGKGYAEWAHRAAPIRGAVHRSGLASVSGAFLGVVELVDCVPWDTGEISPLSATVLVWSRSGFMGAAVYSHHEKSWHFDDWYEDDDPTHWKPIVGPEVSDGH